MHRGEQVSPPSAAPGRLKSAGGETNSTLCFLLRDIRFRSSGEWRVSGRNDGLQAHADGGLLPESGDRAALPQ